jgi:regulator of protease activity HflC (stomatin/prohibitin superfamily)
VYELGPNGLEVQLRAAQDEAVRALARSVQHTEVYKLRDGTLKEQFHIGRLQHLQPHGTNDNETLTPKSIDTPEGGGAVPEAHLLYYVTEDIKNNLNKQFNNYGVQITSVAITDVKLPDNFQEQMQSKTTHLSAIKEQNMKQKSDMQLLEYKEEIDTTKLARRMKYMEEEQKGKAKCAEIQKEIDLIEADTKLVQLQIDQEMKVKCNKITADAELKIENIKAEIQRITTEISAHTDAEIELLNAEKEALKLQLDAEVEEIRIAGLSKAHGLVAKAEGTAAKKLEKIRKHQIDMDRLEVLGALALNTKTVVSGSSSNNLLADMLVANRQGNVLLNVDGRTGFSLGVTK